MKVIKKLLFVALLLSLILSAGAVFAQDDITFEQSDISDGSHEAVDEQDVSHQSDNNDVPSSNGEDVSDNGDENIHYDESIAQPDERDYFSSIQNAIDSANEGDTVFLDGKTYYGLGVGIQVNKTLTIVGGSLSNPNSIATLDAQKLSPIMDVTASNVVIRGIKFINSHAERYYECALNWSGDNGNLTNSFFENNSALEGGAISWNKANEGYISDCVFRNNYANIGGAFYVYEVNLVMSNCLFENNSAEKYAGALNIFYCGLDLINCKFIDNHAGRFAGALCNVYATATIKNCTFENNDANEEAGAIRSSGNTYIYDSYFKNNRGSTGGAIYSSKKECILFNSSFINNHAQNGGAVASQSSMNIVNNTFKDNSVEYSGAAIWVNGANNNISFNFIDNANSNKYAIHISDENNLTIENNNFTNPENSIGYDELFFEFENNYTGYVGKTISFPFYVYNNLGIPVEGEINLQSVFPLNNGLVVVRDFGTQTLIDGKTAFDINLPSYTYFLNIDVTFYLTLGTYMEQLRITVTDKPIVSIDQPYGDSDDVVVQLVNDATGFAMFDFDGKAYFTEIYNGFGLIKVNDLANGEYNVTVIYSGDHNYPRDEKIYTIRVINAVSSEIDVNESFNGYAGGSIEIPVYAHDSMGRPLEGNVTLYGYATQELVDGKTVFDIKLPDTAAVLSLVLLYENDFKIIQVLVHDNPVISNPKLTENRDITAVYGGKAAYKVLVTKDGKPVTGEYVVFNFNGKNTKVKTDSKGYATLNLATSLKPATYKVKADYNGIGVVNNVKITHVIKASDKKVKKSAKVNKVKISLKKVNGKYLKSKSLKIKFNGKTYKVKTNKKGVAIWKIKKSMLKKLKVGKKVKYTVTYGKDSLTKKLIVRK